MNNKELQAARKLLFLDVIEAAEHIGGVSVRSWQYWESGRSPVPDDVMQRMKQLLDERMAIIETAEEVMQESDADEVVVDYYSTFDEYHADHRDATVIEWRIRQSVAAYFVGEQAARLR